ncbi:MAG: FAD-linked oxidase C-terminal domain-containing protein [Litorilinea sp.]
MTQTPTVRSAAKAGASQSLPGLTQLFSAHQVTVDPVELITYEIDAGMDRGHPTGVFYPESTADVSRLLEWATATGTPLIARGAGTGLAGGAVAEQGGIMVTFARMNQVTALDVAARTATVQVGMVNLAFDALVKEHGLYYPPDPSSGRSAVIGGNIGANAGGPHCFKYGVTTNYVTGLEAVLANGRVVQLGHAAADAPGYDLLGVLVGSEGTLGIATHATVRLVRNAPGVKTMMVAFATDEQAGEAVSAVIAAGLVPATLEMMDQRIMRMIEAYAPVGLPVNAGAGLIVEVDGYPGSLDEQMEEVADILTAHGGYDLRLAQSEAERAQIWYGRKSAAGAVSRLAPAFYLVDVTVPRSTLAPVLAGVNQICDRYALAVGHVFHAGDGNLHPIIPFDPRDADHKARVLHACHDIVALALEYNGSITGEHGVGIEKRAYMPMMYGGAELSAMLDVKRLLDPDSLLNPGKIFPAHVPDADYAAPVELAGDAAHSVLTPATAEEAAALLAGLTAARRAVRIRGAAAATLTPTPNPTAKPTAGPAAPVWLSTEKLAGVSALAPADLYVTVGAGTRLEALQAELTVHKMTVPFVAPWPDITVGGILARNLNAPNRLRAGSVRDNVMAMTVALADGRVLRLGRPVVKNVAGYDLVKLFIGAHGSLGVIIDVTLKLVPQARARRTFVVDVPSVAQGLAWAAQSAAQWFVTTAVVLTANSAADGAADSAADTAYRLRFTLEGLAADIEAEVAELAAALAQTGATLSPADSQSSTSEIADATEAWRIFLAGADGDAIRVRVGMPSMQLGAFWDDLPAPLRTGLPWCFDAGNHLAYTMLTGDAATCAQQLARVRESAEWLGGYAAVTDLPASQNDTDLDRWGAPPATLDIMRGLKACWDPQGILNPGAYVVD